MYDNMSQISAEDPQETLEIEKTKQCNFANWQCTGRLKDRTVSSMISELADISQSLLPECGRHLEDIIELYLSVLVADSRPTKKDFS